MSADPAMLAFYDRKTDYWIDKFGPGPRVHYHTGLIEPGGVAAPTMDGLKAQLVRSQERMLERAASVWGGAAAFGGELVDIGCGLGGSAIWFAQRFGARVTGITPIERHLGHVRRFASQAGVADRVTVELGEAHAIPGEGRFDAAYAIGASNYFDRARWFRHLRTLLRPGGHVGIEDTFLVDESLRAPFDHYWHSRIGTLDEYRRSASEAGFALVAELDVTAEAAGFWRLNVDYSRRMLAGEALSAAQVVERERSIEWLSTFERGHHDGGFVDAILCWRRH